MDNVKTVKPLVTLITDGACHGNAAGKGIGGAACILRFGDRVLEKSAGWVGTTNNRMEIRALILGLSCLKRPCRVHVVTDSKYLILVAEKFRRYAADGWMKRSKSGKSVTKKTIRNADLLRSCFEVAQPHSLSFEWVRGHNGHADNERCDRLASAAIKHASEPDGAPPAACLFGQSCGDKVGRPAR